MSHHATQEDENWTFKKKEKTAVDYQEAGSGKLSNPALIPLNENAFQPFTILLRRDHTAAAKKQAEYSRALETLIEEAIPY